MQESGLRERKKQRTRQEIVAAALRLFRERGFDATTVADIAAAADIAPRTFFAYFRSKEDVVFHDFDETLAGFARRVRERPDSETTFDALRAWIVTHIEESHPVRDEERLRKRLIDGTASLEAHHRANLARFQAVLAEGVARDLGTAPDALRTHLVSAAAVGAIDALGRFYEEGDDVPEGDAALATMDEAIVFLRGGLDALRRHPPA